MEFTRDNVSFFAHEVVSNHILCVSIQCDAFDQSGKRILSRIYTFKAFTTPEGEDPYEYVLAKKRNYIIERMLWHLNND